MGSPASARRRSIRPKPFRVYLPAHLRGFRLGCGSGDEPGRRRVDLKAGVVLQADEISNVTPKAQIVDVKFTIAVRNISAAAMSALSPRNGSMQGS